MSLDSYEIMGGKNRDYQPYLKASLYWSLLTNLGGGNSNIFGIFTPIWGRFPFLLIFFRWVETTN